MQKPKRSSRRTHFQPSIQAWFFVFFFFGRCYSELTDQGLQNYHSIKAKSNKANTIQQHKQNLRVVFARNNLHKKENTPVTVILQCNMENSSRHVGTMYIVY